jgi:hypothetical protein
MPNHHLLSFRTVKLRANQLANVERHNSRAMPVPHADPAVRDGVRQIIGAGTSLKERVDAILAAHGAMPPPKAHYIAVEAVYGLPSDAPNQPSDEEFCARALRHAEETFGRSRLASMHLHLDERSRHIHVVAVPMVQAWPPGSKVNQRKDRTPPWRVSWNLFSGSDKLVLATTVSGKTERRNPVMAGWQTRWAEMWPDYGFERGAPSSRPHLQPPHLRGTTAEFQELAEATKQQLLSLVKTHPWEEKVLGKEFIGLVLAQLVAKQLDVYLQALVELARRGIQLPSERDARIETALQVEGLMAELAKVSGEVADLTATVARLAAANTEKDARLHAAMVECEHFKARASAAEAEVERVLEEQDRAMATKPHSMRSLPTPQGSAKLSPHAS